MSSIAFLLMEKAYPSWRTAEDMQRAKKLLMQARAIAPDSETVLNYAAQWLRKMGRYQEGIAVAEQLDQELSQQPGGLF